MGIVGLCSDHAGFELKEYIKTILDKRGLSYKDFGTYSSDSCDYPDFAHLMGKAVEAGEVYPGIAVCGVPQTDTRGRVEHTKALRDSWLRN